MRYYFGFYHWRRHRTDLLGVLIGVGVLLGSILLGGLLGLLGFIGGGGLLAVSARNLRVLFKPSPWDLDRDRFDRLAAGLQFEDADTVVDIGCGTGRSVVGLADHVATDTTVIGIDRFDDQIILGNSPALARRNAGKEGIDLQVLQADGRAIPLATDSVDVVTIGQVLHDLPESVARGILEDAARICRPAGRVGLIELPLVNDAESVDPEHWQELSESVGLEVKTFERVPWKDDQETAILTARPRT